MKSLQSLDAFRALHVGEVGLERTPDLRILVAVAELGLAGALPTNSAPIDCR